MQSCYYPLVELISHLRQLQVLESVAACGSFSGAADALQLTQSAVSQHVAALERAMDLLLIERGTRPVQLTEAGFALVRHARALMARIGAAEQELGEISGRRHGRLRFGSFPTALATFVPAALAQFKRQHADVSLTVIDDHLQRLLPRLDAGELDLAIIYEHQALPEVSSRQYDRVHLLDDTFRAVLPPGHRLARSGHDVSLAELADQNWIGGGPASTWFRIVRHTCRAAGFDPRVALTTDDNVAVQAFAAAGLGVAVIPGLAVAHALPQVEVRTIRGLAPVRRIWAARPHDPFCPPAARAMIDTLQLMAKQAAAPSALERPD
jgi:DNA-binding transcriptional LysR family regulator